MLHTYGIKIEKKLPPLSDFFRNKIISDSLITAAGLEGYKQTSIAEYLIVSPATIARRVKKFKDKQLLFDKIKQQGLFWSYSKDIEYSEANDSLLMEQVLKYGEFLDLKKIFLLYGKREAKRIWIEKLVKDPHFIKLNYFLARNFFGMDIEVDFFKGGISDREQKLRMLAS
jgi:putative transposase